MFVVALGLPKYYKQLLTLHTNPSAKVAVAKNGLPIWFFLEQENIPQEIE